MPNAKIHNNIPVAKLAPPAAPGEAPGVPGILVTEENIAGMKTETNARVRHNMAPERRQAPGAVMQFVHREIFDRILGPSVRYYHHSSLNGMDNAVREKDMAREFNALPEVQAMRKTAGMIAALARRHNDPLLRDLMKVCTAYDQEVTTKIKECWDEIIYTRDEKDPFYVPYMVKMGGSIKSLLHKHLCGKTVVKNSLYGNKILKRKTEIRYKPVMRLFEDTFQEAIAVYGRSGDPRLQALATQLEETLRMHGTVSVTDEKKDVSDKEALAICAEHLPEARTMALLRNLLPLRNRRHRGEDPETIACVRSAVDEYFKTVERKAGQYLGVLRKTYPHHPEKVQAQVLTLLTKDSSDLRLMLRGEGRWKKTEPVSAVFGSPVFLKAFQKLETHCRRFPSDGKAKRMLGILKTARDEHRSVPLGKPV